MMSAALSSAFGRVEVLGFATGGLLEGALVDRSGRAAELLIAGGSR